MFKDESHKHIFSQYLATVGIIQKCEKIICTLMKFATAIYYFCYYYFPSLQYICDACICNVSLYLHLDSKSHSMAVLLCGEVYMPMKCFGSSVPSCPKPRLCLAVTVKKINIKLSV